MSVTENEYFSIDVDKDDFVTVTLKNGKTKYINSTILESNRNCSGRFVSVFYRTKPSNNEKRNFCWRYKY